MTHEMCVSGCASLGFSYAGTQNGYACFCDNNYGSCTVSERDAMYLVPGNSAQICGGSGRNSIFRVR